MLDLLRIAETSPCFLVPLDQNGSVCRRNQRGEIIQIAQQKFTAIQLFRVNNAADRYGRGDTASADLHWLGKHFLNLLLCGLVFGDGRADQQKAFAAAAEYPCVLTDEPQHLCRLNQRLISDIRAQDAVDSL